ncbi:MAG: hypothetical protein J0G33_01305 [Afipia felis]|nr:hypothetical protein [Afipia felis]
MNADRDPNDLARSQEEWRRRQTLDNDLQADPELAEGPAGGGRMALFAIAVLAILGVVLYGLNSTSPTDTASNPPAQTTASGSTAPGKMSPNTNPGQTTGSAPAPSPQMSPPPPAANPSPGSAASGSNAPAGASGNQ